MPLRTNVRHALVVPTAFAIQLIAAAFFFSSAETDDSNRRSPTAMPRCSVWRWNPHVNFASPIHKQGVAPGHECPYRQDV